MPCGCTGVCNVLQRSEEGLAGHSATPASPCPPATTLTLPPPTQNLFAAARVHMALRTRQRDPENDTMRKGGAPATANSSRKRCCLVIQEPPAPEVGATDVASSASNNPKASCGSYRPTHSTKLYNWPSGESTWRACYQHTRQSQGQGPCEITQLISPNQQRHPRCHPGATGKQCDNPWGVSAPWNPAPVQAPRGQVWQEAAGDVAETWACQTLVWKLKPC